ncbi:carbonic anhydrase [Roseivirga sp. E12]|uniref:carbonic anhydrase n=1 Tax=Roseivirga sp. E12 TaxID=2819237 RepID=UPI001ABD0DCE|nr:carbonic anhydrase [Roseivirga sp. E12]MBO3697799.1 carbonic anhydrase [Roseivirga sp. E12]
MTAQEALVLLTEGNQRYQTGQYAHPNTDTARRDSQTGGQAPFAIVLSCADSRVAPELLFDRGIGDLFIIRVAGNVIDDHAIGSIEYAVAHLGTKLIVVMGHESCGAVGASLGDADPGGHIGSIVKKIKPAVNMAKQMEGDLLTNSIKVNAQIVGEELKETKPILSDAVKNAGVEVVSAYYKLSSGEVEFLS